jgi:hypothetical protein
MAEIQLLALAQVQELEQGLVQEQVLELKLLQEHQQKHSQVQQLLEQ